MKVSNATNHDINELKSELQNLAAIVGRSTKKALNGNVHTVEDYVQSGVESVQKTARQAGRDARAFVSDKSEQATNMYHAAERGVSDNPMRSVAAATVAGFVLSLLFRAVRKN